MDVFMICGLLVLFIQESFAINCHDCTSWSPYCREGVDLPFPAAVATSECKKTDTCYLKKEENGVITRGCADWWMSSTVDINYVGCQTQEVPWMGKQTWCFCQEDYCNGGTIQEIENGIGQREPGLRDEMGARAAAGSTAEPITTSNPWDQDWESIDWNQWTWNEKTGAWESSELNDLSKVNDDNVAVVETTTKQNEYNDFDKDYEIEVKAQSQDPAWNHWYWHADSDRPQWPTNEVREQTTEAAIVAEKIETTTQAIQKPASASQSTPQGEWSEGWEQLLPWWEGNFHQSTTMPPVGIQDLNVIDKVHDQDGDDLSQVIDIMPEVEWVDSPQIIDNAVEISEADFFCWDCYSDSPLCGETVDSTKAHYLGKTACPATNKCFVRHDGDVTYRGCADGWIGSVVNHDYVGCEVQKLWGKEVEWCFCTASLCNGDSMMDIQEKYLHSEPEVFKGDVMNSTSTQVYDKIGSQFVNTARTTRSIRNETVNTASSIVPNTDSAATTTSRTVVTDRTTTARNAANAATDKTSVVTADKTNGTSEATSIGKTETDSVTTAQQAKGENKESAAQGTSKTEEPTSSQSTATVKIEAYMNKFNTTTVDSNSTSSVTATEGTQPIDTQNTVNATSPTSDPSNQTAITQNVNDNTTYTLNTTSITNTTTTENSTKLDMTDSKSTTTETVTGDAGAEDTKTSTSGYTKTSTAESKTTTSKAAIRKRESGMKERVVEAKNSKLYEALIGK